MLRQPPFQDMYETPYFQEKTQNQAFKFQAACV